MPTPEWATSADVRERVEAEMPGRLFVALTTEVVPAVGIAPDRWLEVPSLRQAFVVPVAARLVQEHVAEGGTTESALLKVSMSLGIPEKTLGTWIRRWRSAAPASSSK